jgi:hypothetical protein
MGVLVNPQMLFELNYIMAQHELQDLVAPFNDEELDAVAKELPNDKAPGPDGFNGYFFQEELTFN